MKNFKSNFFYSLAIVFFTATLILSCSEGKVITDENKESAIQAIDELRKNLTDDKVIDMVFDISSNKYYFEFKDVLKQLDNGKVLRIYKGDDGDYIAEEAHMILPGGN